MCYYKVVIGATGIVTKVLKKYLEAIQWKREVDSLKILLYGKYCSVQLET